MGAFAGLGSLTLTFNSMSDSYSPNSGKHLHLLLWFTFLPSPSARALGTGFQSIMELK